MWRCRKCGTMMPNSAVCTSCGQPIDEALGAISRKMRTVSLRHNVANQWIWAGAKTGFVLGIILSTILAVILVVRHLLYQPSQETMLDILFMVLLVFVILAGMFLPMLSAFIFLIIGAVIKPIWIALFCSVECFEQEYGSTET